MIRMAHQKRAMPHGINEDELLPPTAKRRVFERIGLKIREYAGVSLEERLDPWALAPKLKLRVMSVESVQGLSAETLRTLSSGTGWSGGASLQLPDGSHLVFLNPSHSPKRQAATLMEEVSHVFLGHRPSKIYGIHVVSGATVPLRDYHAAKEEAAYSVGAAALMPYFPLRRALLAGLNLRDVARHYGISQSLIEYRLKVCRLWTAYVSSSVPGQ